MRKIRVKVTIAALALAAGECAAQSGPILAPHVPYVATSREVAEAMLSLAQVKASDVVYDLGCGDGRIVILAAHKFGARGVGVDIDPDRVREARENARSTGVEDRVRFVQADLFSTDLHDATVVTMFLLPSINLKLRPRLLRQLRPGARIVTHSFPIGDWKPDRRIEVGGVPVSVWTVPETTQVSGRVLVDGGAPPVAASLERVCKDRVTFEGYTEPAGDFTIALPRDEMTRECRLRAALPGYRSDTVPLAASAGTIRLERSATARGRLFSATTDAAPAAAREAYRKGREALERGDRDAAARAFASAVELAPRFAMAWYELGALRETGGQPKEAAAAFDRAMAADPEYLSPQLGLAQIAVHENRWADVTRIMDRVLRLDPVSFPDAWLYHAVGNLTLRNLDAAAASAREAMRLDTEHQFPRAEYVLGLALAGKGDVQAASVCLRHYLEADPTAPDVAVIREELKKMEGQR